MANNIDVTPGTGKTVAAEEVGAVIYQQVKLLDSTATSTSPTGVAANPLQVSIANTGLNGTPIAVASHAVTNAGTFAVQATVAAGATNIAKAEDAASASADVGVPAMAIQLATPTDLAGTDADYAILQMAGGRLWVDASGKTLTVGSHAVTNAGTFAVQTTAQVPGTGATNLGKAEDAAHTSGDVGVMALGVRNDAGTTLAGTDGDYAPLSVDANGALWVTGGGGGTQYTEDAAAAANPVGNALNMVRDDARGGGITTTDGDNIAARGTNAGELYVKHVDAIPITDNAGSLTVDGTVTAISGTAANLKAEVVGTGTFAVQATVAASATNIAKAEDAASASADVGVPAMAIQLATPTDLAGTDADYAMLQMAGGRLWVDASGKTLTVGSHAVTNAGTFAVQVDGAALTSLQLIDDTVFTDDAAFTPATSKLLAIGFQADEASTDSVDEGDIGTPRMTLARKPYAVTNIDGYRNATFSVNHAPSANTKATITKSAQAAGIKNVCTGFTVSLAAGASAPAAVQVSVALIDGATGGTTYLWGPQVISLPATAGAMAAFVRSNIFIPGTAATDMTLEFSAAGGANTIESVSFEGTTTL